ncbi:MAG: hypothetical protein PHD61_12570 [Bacteroidales bacterium]|nr:hypothetical protein [Lentimicrobiaceae bacterium]MDD5696123.1 hypothetical protein [Bacteroidales bacterium]
MPLDAVFISRCLAAYNFEMSDGQVTDRDLSGYTIITTHEGPYYAFDKLTDIFIESFEPPEKGHLYYLRHRCGSRFAPKLAHVELYTIDHQPLQLDGPASVFPNTLNGEVLHIYRGPVGMTCTYRAGWFRSGFDKKITIDAVVTLQYRPNDPSKKIHVEMTGHCRKPIDGYLKTVALQAESFNPLVTTQQTSAVYRLMNPYLQIL